MDCTAVIHAICLYWGTHGHRGACTVFPGRPRHFLGCSLCMISLLGVILELVPCPDSGSSLLKSVCLFHCDVLPAWPADLPQSVLCSWEEVEDAHSLPHPGHCPRPFLSSHHVARGSSCRLFLRGLGRFLLRPHPRRRRKSPSAGDSGAGAQVHGQGNWAVWPLFRSIRSSVTLKSLRGLTSAETSTAWSA